MSIDHREIHTLRFVSLELVLQTMLRIRSRRKNDQARRVAIDAMDDERAALPARPQMGGQLLFDAVFVASSRQRHRQQAGRLVDDDQGGIFVDDLEPAVCRSTPAPAAAGAARPIHPDTDAVPGLQAPAGIGRRHLGVVQEDLPALERSRGAAARAELAGFRKEPVEPRPSRTRPDDEPEVAFGRYT
jgi:hypothetical protein